MRKVTTINFVYETNGKEDYKPADLLNILIDKTDGCLERYSVDTTIYKDNLEDE